MSGRGVLTEKTNEIAKRMIGRGISLRELRLIPYVQYTMVNNQKLELRHINSEEREIWKNWKNEGYVEGGASGITITKHFWDFMCEILFETYVDIN